MIIERQLIVTQAVKAHSDSAADLFPYTVFYFSVLPQLWKLNAGRKNIISVYAWWVSLIYSYSLLLVTDQTTEITFAYKWRLLALFSYCALRMQIYTA